MRVTVADPLDPVGVVGLGQMGSAMARTLLDGGRRVCAWDVASSARQAAAATGVDVAVDPAAVAAAAPIVVTSLPDRSAVTEAVLGGSGLSKAGREDLLVVDTSTTTPQDARVLASQFRGVGIDYIDAPVTGGPGAAAAGQLGIMVGGDEALFERALPILKALGSIVVRCGPLGSGQVVKASNQLIVVATLGAVGEALSLVRAAGVDPVTAREVLLSGYAASPILEGQGGRMLRRDFEPGGKARFNLKDRLSVAELSAATGVATPVFEAAMGYIDALVKAGGGDLDHSAIVTVIEGAVEGSG